MSDERVLARLTKDFVPVLANRDEESKWAREHNIRGIPTVHFVDAAGDIMNTLPPLKRGSTPDEKVAAVLEEMDSYFEIEASLDDIDSE